MDLIQKKLLEAVAGLHEIPTGAFNIRSNGKSVERRTTEHIDILSKEDGSGIDIRVKPEVRGESVHIHQSSSASRDYPKPYIIAFTLERMPM